VERYPTEKEEERIKTWPGDDAEALMEYVHNIWAYADWGWHQRGRWFRISTAGWSGNESIIGALRENFVFWSRCWVLVRRGGHYVFELPEKKKEEDDE